MNKYFGVDMSSHQSPSAIDYKKMAKATYQGSLVKYAILRLGYIKNNVKTIDSAFLQHYSKLKSAGIYVGLYIYSYAKNEVEATLEAEFVLDTIKRYSLEIDYPIFFDYEDSTLQALNLGKSRYTSIAKAFLERIKENNFYGAIYTNPDWLETRLNKDELLKNYDLWLAHWTKNGADGNQKKLGQTMWQSTAIGTAEQVKAGQALTVGKLQGVSCPIDINWSYIGYAAKISKLGMNKFIKKYTVTGTKTVTADKLLGVQGILKANGFAVDCKEK